MAARDAGVSPSTVPDEEIAYPGTYEFLERTAERKEVKLDWLSMQQPMINIFNPSSRTSGATIRYST